MFAYGADSILENLIAAKKGLSPESRLLVTWNQGFCVVTQYLELLRDGSLLLTEHTHFTDKSGRADYNVRESFAKGLVHDWSN